MMEKSLDEILKDIRKNIDDFFGVSPDDMDTEALRDTIDNESDFFSNMQESIANEIGVALTEMTEKNYDKAFIRLCNLQEELIEDVKISREKELRQTPLNF